METEEMTVQVLQMLQWWVAVCFDQEGSELAPLFFFLLTSFQWALFLYLISFSISYLLNHTANLISYFFFYHDLETFFIHPNFPFESFTTELNNLNEMEIKLKTLVICKYCAETFHKQGNLRTCTVKSILTAREWLPRSYNCTICHCML